MAFELDEALLVEYDRWRGERKIAVNDISPTTFLVERAQRQAFERLTQIMGALAETKHLLDDPELPDPTIHDLVKNLDDILEDG